MFKNIDFFLFEIEILKKKSIFLNILFIYSLYELLILFYIIKSKSKIKSEIN